MNVESVLITGANVGLGKDCARQFAELGLGRIILGCRNLEKAKAAKEDLQMVTGKSVFEILIIDVSDLDSVRKTVLEISDPIDALVMNAGGMGGVNFAELSNYGCTNMITINLLGHALLLEELLKSGKLKQMAMYAGSEAARGISKMGLKPPSLKNGSAAEMQSTCDGSFFKKEDPMEYYAMAKYLAALYISAVARKYPDKRILTVSPGGTSGTEVMKDLPAPMKLMFSLVGSWLMPLLGMMHELEKGARRYVDVVTDENYKTGIFYGSEKSVITGPMVDQSRIHSDFTNTEYQDNAYAAIHSYIK